MAAIYLQPYQEPLHGTRASRSCIPTPMKVEGARQDHTVHWQFPRTRSFASASGIYAKDEGI